MLHFIDFEVFKEDWLCVIVEPFTRTETIIINDRMKLLEYYEKYKNEIFVGHNIRQYDQYIFKAILLGLDPKKINDKIIIGGKKGFEISNLFNEYELIYFDTMTTMHGLKTLEAFMGDNIHETGVAFDINRKLTEEEIKETVNYCKNDVYETIKVFYKRFDEFIAVKSLITAFNLPMKYISKTKAQLSAIILDCVRKDRNDEWELYAVDTLKLNKYKYIKDWFLNKENHNYNNELIAEIAGVEHKFAWGGLHGARSRYHSRGRIYHVDVASFYPSIMIAYNLLSRNVRNPEKYKLIKEKRLIYKKEKNKLQLPYKIVLNSTFGICKDKYSSAFDPRNANLICINGQLLLLDLIEKLESIGGFILIQSNTDGLIVEIPDNDEAEKELYKICNEWETRTHMELEFDAIEEIWQKDVNNYIFKFKNGKYEKKGGYVKNNHELDNDMPIINEALSEYMTKGTLIEDTINNCNELIKFQKIVKVSSKYKNGWHNNKFLNDKTYRVFASNDINDTYVGKQKEDGATIEKFANTPENAFIDNTNIKNKTVPAKLNKNYYIELAKERLAAFYE